MSYAKGLEGVVVDETKLSNVEGEIGRLTYRGYPIEALVSQDYVTVMWLVLFGDLPSDGQRLSLETYLSLHGSLCESDVNLLRSLQSTLHPMAMLQGMIPLLQMSDVNFSSLDSDASRGLQIVAKIPTLIAYYHRIQEGLSLIEFRPEMSYLESFLMMFNGQAAEEQSIEVLKVAQILQLEHSFNAGTFASKCVSSTLASINAVMAAGVGALSGELHGGADEAAVMAAREAASPENAKAFVSKLLARKGKLMGMGHREYKVVDPRALILKPMAESLCKGTPAENLYETLQALEIEFNAEMQARGKDLWANVEYYKGAVFVALGIPADNFTALFAMARSVRWLAHFIEDRQDNRIFRPKAEYTGQQYRDLSA
ncbi:citrate/2-methylcitrate synthase [Pseudomonadales bacterium]|nr:citrate/2-methylcitrate synthase [Pseudomonadales bacterium]